MPGSASCMPKQERQARAACMDGPLCDQANINPEKSECKNVKDLKEELLVALHECKRMAHKLSKCSTEELMNHPELLKECKDKTLLIKTSKQKGLVDLLADMEEIFRKAQNGTHACSHNNVKLLFYLEKARSYALQILFATGEPYCGPEFQMIETNPLDKEMADRRNCVLAKDAKTELRHIDKRVRKSIKCTRRNRRQSKNSRKNRRHGRRSRNNRRRRMRAQ